MTQRVTANLPQDLLRDAREVTGKGITETLIEALELLRRQRVLKRLQALRGKIDLDLDIDALRGRDRPNRR